ncbi:MAG: glycosyltransferase [Acidobacteria bacterium]|nr:glycosyltransferase [Acidobacteriota bacterium]
MRVALVVNASAESPIGDRARQLARLLGGGLEPSFAFRGTGRAGSALRMLVRLRRIRPAVIYVFDMAVPGVAAASVYKLFSGCPLLIETGDEIHALAKSMGRRGAVALALTAALELWSLAIADGIVTRGLDHAAMLRGMVSGRVDCLPDGVDVDAFEVDPALDLRRRWAPNQELVVGLVGSLTWNRRMELCYGWDLVEALALLKTRAVRGVIIGDGDGRPSLERRCKELGVADAITFEGRVEFEQLPRYLSALDVCLSTQTNDEVGRARTTGKLPVYMAAGKFILATRVGEAARVLPEIMLLEFEGSHDPRYPERLAERIDTVLDERELLRLGEGNRLVARERFDYRRIAPRLENLLYQAGKRRR